MYKGYMLPYKGVDVFFVTSRTRKTEGLARQICRALQVPAAPAVIADILNYGWFGECMERNKDIEIRNSTHGGYGNFYEDYEKAGVKPVYFIDGGG